MFNIFQVERKGVGAPTCLCVPAWCVVELRAVADLGLEGGEGVTQHSMDTSVGCAHVA